jgi:hypothetical protein
MISTAQRVFRLAVQAVFHPGQRGGMTALLAGLFPLTLAATARDQVPSGTAARNREFAWTTLAPWLLLNWIRPNVLQEAPDVTGPWTPYTNLACAQRVEPTGASR